MATYDYIVVGAGTSGCVLADELSKDPAAKVLLVEFGKRDRSPIFHLPKGFAFTIHNPQHSWVYETEPYGPLGQTEKWSRGKVRGGSSAINGMVWNRGWKDDWDSIVDRGNPGWGWDEILPLYKEIEDHELGESDTRGAGGPMHISMQDNGDPVNEAMLEAATRIGLERVDDPNGSDAERVGYCAGNIKNGLRQSASKVFLNPAEKRPNLTVRLETRVTRILLEGDKATGVQVQGGTGAPEDVHATKQVILALGNMETPKLLELSGIGASEVLKPLGIDVRIERPRVGEDVGEHRYFPLQLRLNDAKLGFNKTLSSAAGQGRAALKYFATRKGPLATTAYDCVGYLKTDPDQPRVDSQILLTPFSQGVRPIDISLEERPGATIIGYPLRPTSTGRQHIASADPTVNPRVWTNYDFTDDDKVKFVNLFRRMRDIAAQHPFADLIDGEAQPGWAVQTEEAIIDHGLLNGGTSFHAYGACAMGPEEDAVVDPQLRVRGVDGLRIMDASVLPVMVSGNLNAPLMAMALRAARMIRDES